MVQRQVASLTSLGGILRAGMNLEGVTTAQTGRMRVANEVFEWLEKVFANAPPLPAGGGTTRGRRS